MQKPSRLFIFVLILTPANSVEVSNKHLVIRCTVKFNELSDDPKTLFDTGVTGEAFMDKRYAQQQGFFSIPLIRLIPLQGFDGNVTGSGPVTHFAYILFAPPGHKPQFTRFFLTDIPQFPIVINLPWMKNKFTTIRLKPDISTINFEQLDQIYEPVTVPETMETNSLTAIDNSGQLFSPLLANLNNYQPPSVEKIPDEREHELEEFPISRKRKLPEQRSQKRKRARILKKGKTEESPKELVKDELPEVPFEIKMITAAPFFHVSKQKGVKLFSVFLKNVEKALKPKQHTIRSLNCLQSFTIFLNYFLIKKQTNYHRISRTTTKSNS